MALSDGAEDASRVKETEVGPSNAAAPDLELADLERRERWCAGVLLLAEPGAVLLRVEPRHRPPCGSPGGAWVAGRRGTRSGRVCRRGSTR